MEPSEYYIPNDQEELTDILSEEFNAFDNGQSAKVLEKIARQMRADIARGKTEKEQDAIRAIFDPEFQRPIGAKGQPLTDEEMIEKAYAMADADYNSKFERLLYIVRLAVLFGYGKAMEDAVTIGVEEDINLSAEKAFKVCVEESDCMEHSFDTNIKPGRATYKFLKELYSLPDTRT